MFSSALFAERFLEACKRADINPRSLFGAQIKRDVSNLAKWRAEKSVPGSDIVYTVAKMLDVSADFLLGLSDEIERPKIELPDDEKELLRCFRAADPVLQSAALAVLRSSPPRRAVAGFSPSQSADLPEAL